MKKILLCLSLANIAVGIIVVPIYMMIQDYGAVVLLGKYKELDYGDVIDHGKLENFQNGRFADDWADVPYYLMENTFHMSVSVAWFIAILFFFNSVVILWVRSRIPGKLEGTQNS